MCESEPQPEFHKEDSGPNGIDPQRLCDAASALFYTIAKHQFHRTGDPIPLPLHLCPKSTPPCICGFSRHEIDQAEAFLLRLGVIKGRGRQEVPLIEL